MKFYLTIKAGDKELVRKDGHSAEIRDVVNNTLGWADKTGAKLVITIESMEEDTRGIF